MLVLARKLGEKIFIGGEGGVPLITITVVGNRDGKVRLGVEAPEEVPVHRQEVYEAIHGVKAPPPAAPVVVKTDDTGTRA